ncbi:3SC5B7.11c, hypothetical protein [Actinobacteria bacterium OK074]|nr:3SC5B7.11c, hypothetical protein [Actinobacteria bacterium OK074]
MLHTMSTKPPTPDPSHQDRSAEEVNAEIRALWLRSGGTLTMDQRREYQRLVLEWASASPRSTKAA